MKKILITGANGFVASHIVLKALEAGYIVHATVRDLGREYKYEHLLGFQEQYKGQLFIYEANILNRNAFETAMLGCDAIIHTASPFFTAKPKNATKQLIEPALEGTRNLLYAAHNHKSVKKIVLTSSVAAIYGDAADITTKSKKCFSAKDWNTTSSNTHQPYNLSKTLAEQEAWKLYESQNQWELVTINPGLVFGTPLNKDLTSGTFEILGKLLSGKYKHGIPNLEFGLVDVEDVARAHIRALDDDIKPNRYILVDKVLNLLQIARLIEEYFPNRFVMPHDHITRPIAWLFAPFAGVSRKYIARNASVHITFDNRPSVAELGIEYKEVEKSICESVAYLIEKKAI